MASRETRHCSDSNSPGSPGADRIVELRDEGQTTPMEHIGASDIDAEGSPDPDYVVETATEQHGGTVGTNEGKDVGPSSNVEAQAIKDVEFGSSEKRVGLSGSDADADGEPAHHSVVGITSEEQGAAAKPGVFEGHAHGGGVQFNTRIFEQNPTTQSTKANLEQPVEPIDSSEAVDDSQDGNMFSGSERLPPESGGSDAAVNDTMTLERAAEAVRQAILNRLNKRFDATVARVEHKLKEARDFLQQGAVSEHKNSKRPHDAKKETHLAGNEGIEVDDLSDYDEDAEALYNDQLYSKRQKRNSTDSEGNKAFTQRAPDSNDLVSRQKPREDHHQSQSLPGKSAPIDLGPRKCMLRKWRYPRVRHPTHYARMNFSRIHSDYVLSTEFVYDINHMLDQVRYCPRDHAVAILKSFIYDPHNEARRVTFIEDRVLAQHWSVHIQNPNLSNYHPRLRYARHNSAVSGLPECVRWIENGMKGNFSMCRGGCGFGCPSPMTKEEKERSLARGRALRKKEKDEKDMPPPPRRVISPISEVQSAPLPSPRLRPLSEQQIAEMVKAPLLPPKAPRPGPAKLLLTPEQWEAVEPVKPPAMQSPSLLSGRREDLGKPKTSAPSTKIVPTRAPRNKFGYKKVVNVAQKKKNYYVKPLPLSATQVFDFGPDKTAPPKSAAHRENYHLVDPTTPSDTQVNYPKPVREAPYPSALTKSFLNRYRDNLIQSLSKISGQKRPKKQHPKRELWQVNPDRH